jgi:serine/threonine protein kinase
MGEVWKARDTRLDRTVAIKKSAAQFSERFEREAHAVAALNHPHICTLYDVGPDYLVMEYIEGAQFEAGLPRFLFEVRLPGILRNRYVVSANGQRFLVNALVDQPQQGPMTVLVNWPAALKR